MLSAARRTRCSTVAHDPEVEAAGLLVVVAGGSELLQAADFGLDVVGFQVEVHAFLAGLGVGGVLQQDADLGVGQAELAVDVSAVGSDGFLGAAERTPPEGDGLVQVVNVDHEKPVVVRSGSRIRWRSCSAAPGPAAE